MSDDEPLAHYGVKGMKWGKTKAAISKALDVSGAVSKAIIDAQYENKKTDLKAEAFVSSLMGKPSNAQRDLNTLNALEGLAAQGQKSVAKMNMKAKLPKKSRKELKREELAAFEKELSAYLASKPSGIRIVDTSKKR